MRFFRDLPIRRKLTLLLVVVASVVLLLSSAVHLADSRQTAETRMVDRFTALADVLSANLAASLSLDPAAVQRELEDLRVEPMIDLASAFDEEGKVVATYESPRNSGSGPATSAVDSHAFTADGNLQVSRSIYLEGERIGSLFLRISMESLRIQYRRQWLTVAGVLVGCIVVAIALGFPLQRVISNPIMQLTQATQTVSSKADFSIRVEKKTNDELGILFDGFNSMLAHIQHRDTELNQHRQHLEEMVQERTRTLEAKTQELARSNAELAAQHATARALAECSSLSDAAPKVLQAICESLGWDLGAIWSVDAQAEVLRFVDTWHPPTVAVPKFEAITRSRTFSPGVGLPGRVWATAQPAWISDVTVDSNFPRAPIALEEGLHGAFGFPILVSGTVLGVIEFFSREIRQPDEGLLRMMSSIGSQIGQFIERHRMQDRMLQSDKLASIGLLSAGVAHEINNPLAFVSNNLAVLERDNKGLMELVSVYEAARDRLSQVDPEAASRAQTLAEELDLPYVRDNLDRVLTRTREGVQRVTRIVQSLRGLARTPSAQLEEAQLIDLVNVSLEMIRGRLQRRGIVVEMDCDPNLHLRCAASQVSQVLLNLFVNALQAIEAKGHTENGHIRIAGKRVGEEVLIEVSDTGCGIDPSDVPRIFDPFFTTKPVGEGTGLGLSISHGIVTGHGGRFEIDSQPGKGTCFRIFLPQTPKEPFHDDSH